MRFFIYYRYRRRIPSIAIELYYHEIHAFIRSQTDLVESLTLMNGICTLSIIRLMHYHMAQMIIQASQEQTWIYLKIVQILSIQEYVNNTDKSW